MKNTVTMVAEPSFLHTYPSHPAPNSSPPYQSPTVYTSYPPYQPPRHFQDPQVHHPSYNQLHPPEMYFQNQNLPWIQPFQQDWVSNSPSPPDLSHTSMSTPYPYQNSNPQYQIPYINQLSQEMSNTHLLRSVHQNYSEPQSIPVPESAYQYSIQQPNFYQQPLPNPTHQNFNKPILYSSTSNPVQLSNYQLFQHSPIPNLSQYPNQVNQEGRMEDNCHCREFVPETSTLHEVSIENPELGRSKPVEEYRGNFAKIMRALGIPLQQETSSPYLSGSGSEYSLQKGFSSTPPISNASMSHISTLGNPMSSINQPKDSYERVDLSVEVESYDEDSNCNNPRDDVSIALNDYVAASKYYMQTVKTSEIEDFPVLESLMTVMEKAQNGVLSLGISTTVCVESQEIGILESKDAAEKLKLETNVISSSIDINSPRDELREMLFDDTELFKGKHSDVSKPNDEVMDVTELLNGSLSGRVEGAEQSSVNELNDEKLTTSQGDLPLNLPTVLLSIRAKDTNQTRHSPNQNGSPPSCGSFCTYSDGFTRSIQVISGDLDVNVTTTPYLGRTSVKLGSTASPAIGSKTHGLRESIQVFKHTTSRYEQQEDDNSWIPMNFDSYVEKKALVAVTGKLLKDHKAKYKEKCRRNTRGTRETRELPQHHKHWGSNMRGHHHVLKVVQADGHLNSRILVGWTETPCYVRGETSSMVEQSLVYS